MEGSEREKEKEPGVPLSPSMGPLPIIGRSSTKSYLLHFSPPPNSILLGPSFYLVKLWRAFQMETITNVFHCMTSSWHCGCSSSYQMFHLVSLTILCLGQTWLMKVYFLFRTFYCWALHPGPVSCNTWCWKWETELPLGAKNPAAFLLS
jgi:hypothetical protein